MLVSRYDEAIRFLRDPARVTLAPGTPDDVVERLARRYAASAPHPTTRALGPRHYPRAPVVRPA